MELDLADLSDKNASWFLTKTIKIGHSGIGLGKEESKELQKSAHSASEYRV